MRLVLLFGVAWFISLAIQTVAPLWLPVRALVPDLVIILAVDLGLRHHGPIPAVMAFAMGYSIDVFSGTHIGLNALVVTLVYLFAYEVSSRLLMTNALVDAIVVFLGSLATGGAQAAFGLVSGAQGLGATVSGLVLQAGVTAVVSPFIFALLARLKRRIGLRAVAERE